MKKERTTKRCSSIRRNCVNIDDPEFSRKPKEGHGFIYRYHFIKSGKDYIGQTIRTIKQRLNKHYDKRMPVDNMIRSGAEFTIEILSEAKKEYLDDAERYCILKFGSLFPNGFNMTIGGSFSADRLVNGSEDTRRRSFAEYITSQKAKNHSLRTIRMASKANERPVICLETGKVYASGKKAVIDMKLGSTSSLGSVLRGISRTIKGYHFIHFTPYALKNREEVISVLEEFYDERYKIARKKQGKTYSERVKENKIKRYSVPIRDTDNEIIYRSYSEVAKMIGVTVTAVRVAVKKNRRVKGYHFEKVTA